MIPASCLYIIMLHLDKNFTGFLGCANLHKPAIKGKVLVVKYVVQADVVFRHISGSHQAMVRQSSMRCQEVNRKSCVRQSSGSHQAVVRHLSRQSSGKCKAVISNCKAVISNFRQSSDSCQCVSRQSSDSHDWRIGIGSHQAVVRHLSGQSSGRCQAVISSFQAVISNF